jgi:hypothetical protein
MNRTELVSVSDEEQNLILEERKRGLGSSLEECRMDGVVWFLLKTKSGRESDRVKE